MKYVALLRGIGPSNPNMHGSKLKAAAESAGLKNVQTLLASGNVLFETGITDQSAIEDKLEKIWPQQLGFNSMTIVRSQAQLQALVDKDPYNGAGHSRESYLLVTFFKKPPADLKGQPNYFVDKGINALCNVNDTTKNKTTEFMAGLDKRFGKDQITSRTWLTLQRILAKMQSN